MMERFETSEAPPQPPSELMDHEIKKRDKHNLKVVEVNEPWELVTPDLKHPKATPRIGTRLGFEIK